MMFRRAAAPSVPSAPATAGASAADYIDGAVPVSFDAPADRLPVAPARSTGLRRIEKR